ncbi:alpha/beta-hydrolase [Mycena leptocephala]|nr:alpha/beta-hydrolase [Mycena leptocephala]
MPKLGVMWAFFFSSLSFITFALATPLLDRGSNETTGEPTPLSFATVTATLLGPAKFSRAAYCSPATIKSWSCGLPCDSLNGVTVLQTGGDERFIPFYFIVHDAVDQSLVVAHQGTYADSLLSVLNDLIFLFDDIDTARIPQAAGKGIKVHRGFQQTFQRTADELLAGVKAGLESTGVTKVVVTGHSLGAALATMSAAMIKGAVDPSVEVVVTTFALPRGGNKAWADFLDSDVGVTFVTNQNDPVPILPPLFLGFAHPNGEIHIVDSSQNNLVACPGHDNEHCSTGNSLLHFSVSNHRGPYFADISFGQALCSPPEP